MSNIESSWQELLTSALLGTERHPPSLPASNGILMDFLNKLDSSNPQHLLLQGAAAVALYRQAGSLPVGVPAVDIPACEPDEQVRCSTAASSRLATMLDGEYNDMLPEWLFLAASANKRVPEELLPDLLDWGENHIDQVDLLLPVLGKRGRWLVKQFPRGEKITAAIAAEMISDETAHIFWQTGRKAARRMLLRQLRIMNPALALSLLISTWAEESAEGKAAFLETFKVGLSMADEPFLETALEDRSREIRRSAADLLSCLSESRLVGRQTERAQSFLKWKSGSFLRKAQIEVALPESCDKDMIHDGVELKRSVKSFGEKSDWLFQILSAVPPSIWSYQWDKSPSDLLEIAGNGDWKELLHMSWITATVRHQDPEWAEAILKIYPRRGVLLQILPPKRRFVFIAAQIQSNPQQGMDLLDVYHDSWGNDLTRLALPHLREYYSDITRLASSRGDLLVQAKYMDPSITGEIAGKLLNRTEPGSAWEKLAKDLLKILDFRHRMMEEFQ